MEFIMRIKMEFSKKIFIYCFLCGFYIPYVFSQDGVYGASFIKRIEYNLMDIQLAKEVGDELVIIGYKCNSGNKGDVEKLLFGDFNAPVEFFYAPSFEASTDGETGFRIMRDSLNTSWILEVKHIPNYEKVYRECDNKYPLQGIPARMMDSLFLNYAMHVDSNKRIWKQRNDERLKLFKVETLSFTVSDQFAEKLYQKMILFIDKFKAKGRLVLAADGYSVTFRNVVDDEVWSLEIHLPEGNALKFADLCRQMITDAHIGQLNESMYISVLDGDLVEP
jgi:hypothetical protein